MKYVVLLLTLALAIVPRAMADGPIDLTSSVIVVAADAPTPEQKAADMLADEIEKRTYVRLPIAHEWPGDAASVIALGTNQDLAPIFRGRLTRP